MCGLGVAVGCRMKHAKGMFKRWLLSERAGKRQAWTPIRSHGIGEGLPSQQRFKGFKLFRGLERLEGLEGLEGLRAGKRQAWTPIRSHGCVALGCLLAAG